MGLSLDSQPLPPGFQIPLPPPTFKDEEGARVVAKPVSETGAASSVGEERNGAPTEPATSKSDEPAAAVPPTLATEPLKGPTPPPAIGFTPPSDLARVEPSKEPEKGKEIAPAPEPAAPREVADDAVAVAAVAAPQPKPSPTREEMMRVLEAEAEASRLERAQRNMKREQARARVEIEAQDRVEGERALFHNGLARILSAGGSTADAGQRIDALCDQFGRTYGQDLKAQVLGARSQFHGKVSRETEVHILRSIGVPEPGILDYLANSLHRSINSRNGPRSSDGVRVLAAKQLLRAKLPPSKAQGRGAARLGPARIRQPRAASSETARPAR